MTSHAHTSFFPTLVRFNLAFLTLLVGAQVRVVEELSEQNEIWGVHEQRQFDVGVGYIAVQARLLHLNHLKLEGKKEKNSDWKVKLYRTDSFWK